MLTLLLVLMLLCCKFCPMCCLLVDFHHPGLYNVCDIILYSLYFGKCSLDFVVVWNFYCLLLYIFPIWVWVLFL